MAGSSASLSFRLFGVDVSASRTIRGVGNAAERTSHSLGNLGLGLGRVGISAGLTAAKVTGAAAAVANVASALVQAAPAAGLAAPALLTGAQAMFTLKLASDGVKQSMEKFKPQLDSLKKAASGGIAPGLDKGMRSLMTNLPVVREGVRETAKAFGDLAQLGGAVFSGPTFRGDLKTIMSANTVAIRNFGMAGISMARSLVDVAVAASPAWKSLSKFTQSMASSAQAWIANKRATGELQMAIERGVQRIAQFGRIFLNLGATVANVYSAINAGATHLDIFASLERLTRWLRDFTAQDSKAYYAIASFFDAVSRGASTAMRYIRDAGTALATGFNGDTDYGGWIGAFEKIGYGAHVVADKVRKDLLPQLKLAGPAFIRAFSGEGVTSSGWIGIVERLGVNARQLVDFARKDLLPTLLKVGEFLFKEVLPPVLDISNAVRGVLLRAFSAAFTVIRNTVLPALQPLARILRDDVVPLVRQVAQWFQEHLIPAAQDLATRALKPLRGAFDSIRSAIDQNRPQLQAIFNIIKTLASFVLGVAAPVLGVVFGTSIRLMGQAMSISITIIGALVRAITGIVHAVQTVIGWFGRLGQGAANTIGTVARWFSQLPGRIVRAVGSLGNILYGAGSAALNGLKRGAVVAWGAVGGWLRGLPGGIVRQIGNLGHLLYEAGKAVIRGLGEGIEAMKNWVVEKAKSVVMAPINGVKHLLGIHSPSRVFHEMGMQVGQGLGMGMISQRNQVARAAAVMAGGAMVGMQGGGAMRASVRPVSLGSRGGGVTVVHVHVAGTVKTERELVATIRDGLARDKRGNGGRVGF